MAQIVCQPVPTVGRAENVLSPPKPNRTPWSRLAAIVAMALLALVVMIIWFRVPYVPAPSGGDEVWWGEGAYWLLKEGKLRWDWMANPQTMDVQVFWPPTVALFQAGFFWLLGLNAFSLCGTSALACTAMILLTAVAAKRQGAGVALSCLLGLLPFALFGVERRFMQVRMEPWVAIFAVASLNLLRDASTLDGRRGLRSAFLSGICAGVAALSYYPLAPFVSGGLAAAALYGLSSGGTTKWSRLAAFGAGAAMMGSLFATWILQDVDLFRRQILSSETGAYINPVWASGVLLEPFRHPGSPWGLMTVEIVLSSLFGVLAFLRGPGSVRMYGLATAISGLAFVTCSLPDRMSPIGAMAAATAAAWIGAAHKKGSFWPAGTAIGFACIAFARIALVAITASVQRDGRDYGRVQAWLRDAVGTEAPIMTNNVGWLALRESRGPGAMIRLNDALDFSHAFRSNAQRTETGIRAFKYYIVSGQPENSPLRFPTSPAIEGGVSEGWIIEKGRFSPPWKPLPWAQHDPFSIIVLENTRFPGRA